MNPGDGGRNGKKWTNGQRRKPLDGGCGMEEGTRETEVLEKMPMSPA